MTKLIFCKSNDIGGFLIRLFTLSKWNHVAIQVGDYVYESLYPQGVVKTHIDNYKPWDEQEAVDISIEDSLKLYEFLQAQLGKSYDKKAIIAFPFRASWHNAEQWFCSELVAEALLLFSSYKIDEKSSRVTPGDLYKIFKKGN